MKLVISVIFFMVIIWIMKDLDEGHPVRGILIALFGILIATPIGCFLRYIE